MSVRLRDSHELHEPSTCEFHAVVFLRELPWRRSHRTECHRVSRTVSLRRASLRRFKLQLYRAAAAWQSVRLLRGESRRNSIHSEITHRSQQSDEQSLTRYESRFPLRLNVQNVLLIRRRPCDQYDLVEASLHRCDYLPRRHDCHRMAMGFHQPRIEKSKRRTRTRSPRDAHTRIAHVRSSRLRNRYATVTNKQTNQQTNEQILFSILEKKINMIIHLQSLSESDE